MPSKARPIQLPASGVDASGVAVASTLANKRTAVAINQGAGFIGGVRTVTGSTYVSSTDTIVRGDTTAAGFTLRLPRISEYSRNFFLVVRSAGVNTLTLATRGTETIDGGASVAITKMRLVYPTTNSAWETRVIEV